MPRKRQAFHTGLQAGKRRHVRAGAIGAAGARLVERKDNQAVDEGISGHWALNGTNNGSRPLKPEEEEIAGGFEAWTLWGVVSGPMLSDLVRVPPYGTLTGKLLVDSLS